MQVLRAMLIVAASGSPTRARASGRCACVAPDGFCATTITTIKTID